MSLIFLRTGINFGESILILKQNKRLLTSEKACNYPVSEFSGNFLMID